VSATSARSTWAATGGSTTGAWPALGVVALGIRVENPCQRHKHDRPGLRTDRGRSCRRHGPGSPRRAGPRSWTCLSARTSATRAARRLVLGPLRDDERVPGAQHDRGLSALSSASKTVTAVCALAILLVMVACFRTRSHPAAFRTANQAVHERAARPTRRDAQRRISITQVGHFHLASTSTANSAE
jgi:hypothetical protein